MLLELNVKDIALIKKAEVLFGENLNIMTGETGAGKSVIIGSCLLCLGGKAKGDLIREGADSAYIELVFSVEDPEKRRRIEEQGVSFEEDGILTMSRRITPQRSVSKINGETVTLSVLKACASELIDIYGQNEYHTLLDTESHLQILDSYLSKEAGPGKTAVSEAYTNWQRAKEQLSKFSLPEEKRLDEMSRCRYEIEEITRAKLSDGEEEELEARYKKLNNAKNIMESLGAAYGILENMRLESAVSEVEDALRYDSSLRGILSELTDAQSILDDALSGIHSYVSEIELSDRALAETEARLDLVRNLENKYGKTIPLIENYKERKEARLRELTDYEEEKKKAEDLVKETFAVLKEKAEELSALRKKGAVSLCEKIRAEMLELGFEDVKIELSFTEKMPEKNGMDEVGFLVALNPGEHVRPLGQVASGGELSRLMLSVKTVLAGTDNVPTLIFDEIDTGISGRTAQKVAEKLCVIGKHRQVICITHLPQIAAMADTHFVIEKHEEDGRNVTGIEKLSEEKKVEELARLLGGAEITDAVRRNAGEMKELALKVKKNVK